MSHASTLRAAADWVDRVATNSLLPDDPRPLYNKVVANDGPLSTAPKVCAIGYAGWLAAGKPRRRRAMDNLFGNGMGYTGRVVGYLSKGDGVSLRNQVYARNDIATAAQYFDLYNYFGCASYLRKAAARLESQDPKMSRG